MHNFEVDREKCISCGLCVQDCLFSLLQLEEGCPVLAHPEQCIGCLHCFAVCPQGAITMDSHIPADSPAIEPLPDSASMVALARQRRSIRSFKNENCDSGLVRNLLEIAWDAPSGVNQHLLQITVVDDKVIMGEFRRELYSRLVKIAQGSGLAEHTQRLVGILGPDPEKWEKDDRILRHAPHFVVCSYSDAAITGNADAFIYLSWFEALAVTHGLGTLWCGYLDHCLRNIPELAEWLGIPPHFKIGYPMLFGMPGVKYRRGINRYPASINLVSR